MTLHERVVEAKQRLAPYQSKYRVVYEDPDNPEAPACILVPDPNFMALAMAGGVLPPIAAYLNDQAVFDEWVRKGNNPADFSWKKSAVPPQHSRADPIGPLTEEQAIQYLVMKDVPRRVWEYSGNRRIMAIVPVEKIPTDRHFRDAWRINQEAA